jgi:hypothetical protein
MSLSVDGRSALDALYWRAEILQAMYWMRGEGIASRVSAAQLADFLIVSHDIVRAQLTALVDDGYLSCDDGVVCAHTPRGDRRRPQLPGRIRRLTRPAHYECGPGCWCQDPEHIGEPCPSHPVPAPPAPDPDPGEPSDD